MAICARMRIHKSQLRQGELRVKVAVEVKGEEVLVDRLHLHFIRLSVSSEPAGRQGSQRSTGTGTLMAPKPGGSNSLDGPLNERK